MKKYEILLILPGTLDEQEAEKRVEEVRSIVKNHGEETDFNLMGKNRLAYPIKHIRYGYFYTITFETEPDKIEKLKNKLALERDLLRAVISLYDVKLAKSKSISYSTDSRGVTNIIEKKEEKSEDVKSEDVSGKTVEATSKKVNLEDIDKKLDEILQGDIIPKS